MAVDAANGVYHPFLLIRTGRSAQVAWRASELCSKHTILAPRQCLRLRSGSPSSWSLALRSCPALERSGMQRHIKYSFLQLNSATADQYL